MNHYSFSKNQRLCSKSRIEKVFSEGKSLSSPPFRLSYNIFEAEEKTDHLQILISVPKRLFRRATQRNRIKRLIRESFRLHSQQLTNYLSEKELFLDLAIIYTESSCLKYEIIEEKMIISLNRIQKHIQKTIF